MVHEGDLGCGVNGTGEAEAKLTGGIADHKPVQVPNTLAKVGDKAVLEQCQADYVREMTP